VETAVEPTLGKIEEEADTDAVDVERTLGACLAEPFGR
jgi:hypothetical protein